MKLNDLQLNSIYLEEISDTEAAEINGGIATTIAELEAVFAEVQQRSILMRQVATEEGIELNAAKKDVNPK